MKNYRVHPTHWLIFTQASTASVDEVAIWAMVASVPVWGVSRTPGASLAALNEREYWLAAPRAPPAYSALGAAGASLWYRWRPTEKVCRARLPARRGGRVARLRRASKQFGSKGKIAARGTLRRSLYTAVGVPEHSSITKKRRLRLKGAVRYAQHQQPSM